MIYLAFVSLLKFDFLLLFFFQNNDEVVMDLKIEVMLLVTCLRAAPDCQDLSEILSLVVKIYDKLLLPHQWSENLVYVMLNELASNAHEKRRVAPCNINPSLKPDRVAFEESNSLVNEQVSLPESYLVSANHS